MIPQKLSLTNFMCYRRATLDFAGIHVACLSGENGAGKSALLEAITWALWGNTRLGARGDDDLIRLGQDKMHVEFAFDLDGELYRVIRRRHGARHSRTTLDFQVKRDERWCSLVEGGVRATQRKIENILGLDYDTFVNSALLRQGHVDEFTVKTASERKRVLSDILGLDRWSTYEDQVKERQKSIEAELEATGLRLEEIEMELGRRSQYEAQLEAAQAAVDELAEGLEEAQQTYQRMEAARAERHQVDAQIADQLERIEQAEQELVRLTRERSEREKRLEECEQLLAQSEQVAAGYRAYQGAVDLERRLGGRLRQSVELDERRREMESRISEARHQLEARHEMLATRVDELAKNLPTQALEDELEEVNAQLDHLTRLSESREAAKDDLARIAEERATLQARNDALRSDMEALKDRIRLLREADAQCPLCEQPLTEKHCLELMRQIESEGKAKGDAFRANQALLEDLAQQAAALDEQIARSDGELGRLSTLQRQAAALIERVQRGRRAVEELGQAQEELAEVERRLTEEDYALSARAELKRVLSDAAQLGYDSEAHEEAQEAVAKGQMFAERKLQLAAVQERMAEERAALDRLQESEQRWRRKLSAAQKRREHLEAKTVALETELEQSDAAGKQLQEMRAKEAEGRQRAGAAQQRLAACVALEEQLADGLKRKEILASTRGICDELRTAFSVRGVPAMIVEAAVPEIELEANRLLSRMTEGRMHVSFETQRQTKAGAMREALQIRISDELGARSYENYSGGEQFRVNFAVRIALSKLLARRAGARLETLIIDEGFGTQDVHGRHRLVEAIHAVQDEFARVLVVTHISELEDVFPARIEVTKTPQGSTVEVV